MKLIKTIIVLCAFSVSSVYAVDPELADITCEQLGENLELTDEALARFKDLRGTCEGVYEVDGALYTKSKAVIRNTRGGKVRLYLPATDKTVEVTPDSSMRVLIGNRKFRPRDLNRGDEISIYLSVDKFTQERLDEIALSAEDYAAKRLVFTPVAEVAALPTTASPLPLFAVLSALLLAAGLLMRVTRRQA